MEAVPRLPMIGFNLKVCPDRPTTEFGKLKQVITGRSLLFSLSFIWVFQLYRPNVLVDFLKFQLLALQSFAIGY